MLRNLFLRGVAALLFAVLVLPQAEAANKFLKGSRSVVTANYTPFPSLDKNTLPFHTASSATWTQTPLQEPAAPVAATPVNVTSLAALTTQCNLGGRIITITAGFTGGNVSGTCNDTYVIVNPGVYVGGQLVFNNVNRFRIGGTTPGFFSGGTVRYLSFGGGSAATDVLVDGLGLTGPIAGYCLYFYDTQTRVAAVNNRCNSGSNGFGGDGRHYVIAGNSINTGLYDNGGTWTCGGSHTGGNDEAWGVRDGGFHPLVVYANDIRGVRFHRVRSAPNDSADLIYLANNTFVDLCESRIWWVNSASSSHTGVAGGAWFLTNQVYTNLCCLSIDTASGGPVGVSAAYVRVNGNAIRGPYTVTDITINGTGLIDGDKTGNSFSGAVAAPAWGAAGDPTGLDWTLP